MKIRNFKRLVNINYIMLSIVIFFIIIFLSICILNKAKADAYSNFEKSFISIEIEEGDTLSSIAEEYALTPSQVSDYINEIKNINNLKSDNIHTGCYLLIPLYTCD